MRQKRRILALFLVLALMLGMAGPAAMAVGGGDTVTIGTGMESGTDFPYRNSFKYSLTETIYLASEIGEGGTITAIAYNVATAAQLQTGTVKIYMGHTTKNAYVSNTDWSNADDLTLVYTGSPLLGQSTGWETIELDTPFDYNGQDNLIVAVSKTGDTYSTSLKYYYTEGSRADEDYRALYRGNDYTDVSEIGGSTTGSTLKNQWANIQLTIDRCDHTHADDDAGIVTPPTCTEQGYTTYTCTICGNSYQDDFVDALGHDLVTTTTPATCTEDGETVVTCQREGCGYTETTVLPATGHTPQEGSEQEYDTYYTYTCAVCGETYTVYKDERLQAMSLSGVTATLSEGGTYEWAYDETGKRLQSTNYNVDSTTSQTTITLESEYDFTLSFDYAVSSEANYDKLTIKLDNETIVNGISGTKSGTYTNSSMAAGTHTLTLAYTKDSSQKANDDRAYVSNLTASVNCTHENRTEISHTDATCTEAAYTTYRCEDCGAEFNVPDEGSAPLGHDFGDDGYCTRCGVSRLVEFSGFFYGLEEYLTAENDEEYPWTPQDGWLVSGNSGVGLSDSSITITALADGTLTFDYWAEGEGGYDYFYTMLNSSETSYKGSGTSAVVHQGSLSVALTAGDILVLGFYKDSSGDKGADCAKVSNFAFTTGTAAPADTIEISSVEELKALADEVNSGDSKAGKYYLLTCDLTLPGDFTPIGCFNGDTFTENAFAGTFDGGGHTITLNLTDATGADARVGLFGSIQGTANSHAVVKNLMVTGSVQVTGGGYCVAALVGCAQYADIINCGSAAAVTAVPDSEYGTSNAAGILGRANGSVTITRCFNVGTITAVGYAGGIVDDVNADGLSLLYCYNVGALTATGENGIVGGLVASPGTVSVSLESCYAGNTAHYSAVKTGAVSGIITQGYTMSNVWYEASGELSWCGGNTYGWSGSAPQSFTSYADLLGSLNDQFKQMDNVDYLLLNWQEAAMTPAESHTHSFTETVTEPTCTEDGYTTHSCACGYSYVDSVVPALGHDLAEEITCNHDGTHSQTCQRCGETVVSDCTFDEGVVTTAPTATTDGVRTYTCTVCGYTYTEVIPATGFEGSGTETDPYLIQDAADLQRLADQVNSGNHHQGDYFLLTADVTAGDDFTPIGSSVDTPFAGVFDGGGHTVTLAINRPDSDFNGLFGALVNAVVEKVVVDGTVTGGSFTAGIAGYAYGSEIRLCGNDAAITGGDNHTYGQNEGPNDAYTAGIVAFADESTVQSCYNHGNVTNAAVKDTMEPGGSRLTGGIVGDMYDGSIQYSYNTGAVTASGTSYVYTGGILGMGNAGTALYCYNAGTVTGGTYTGGVVGSTNAYYFQTSFNYYLVGTAATGIGQTEDDPSYVTSATEAELKGLSGTVAEMLGSNYTVPEDGGYLILAWENGGEAVLTYVTEIYTVADLYAFANAVRGGHDYAGETVTLMADLDLGGWYTEPTPGYGYIEEYGNIWTAIGDTNGTVFAGTFDGNGKEIAGVLILNSSSGYLGFFSAIAETAVVRNLTLRGEIITGINPVGGVVGWNLGLVENCVSYLDITASGCDGVGGIVGDNAATVTGCVNYGTISGGVYSDYVGGVVGHNEPAYVIVNMLYVAVTTPVVTDCVNYGDVSGNEYVGGIIGGSFSNDGPSGNILRCANHGNVIGYDAVGGIVGYMGADSLNTEPILLSDCYNDGDVTGYRSYTVPTVYTGGIVGEAWLSELTISNCYNAGQVSAVALGELVPPSEGNCAGAIAGRTKATVINTYYQLGSVDQEQYAVGTCSGENYARPVSVAYMATEEFAEMLGDAYDYESGTGAVLTVEH